jgi:pyruvate-ferredoxin/flavodoxin oxidoreductase
METDLRVQGYFVYDSKKSGAVTVSHLRFGPRAIRAPYLIAKASARFVACHQWELLEKNEVLEHAAPGAVCLINSPYPAERLWEQLSRESQRLIVDRGLRLHTIDAYRVAKESGMGGRINTIMQTCFFAISGVLPREEAVAQIKKAIQKTYARKGEAVVRKNFEAVDRTLEHLQELKHQGKVESTHGRPMLIPPHAGAFVHQVTGVMMAGKGDELAVSVLPADGTWPLNTSRWEKRNLAAEVPLWDPALCIQCNKCTLVCPHASLRAKFYPESELKKAPEGFKSAPFRSREHSGHRYTLQLAAEDCTGCGLCIQVCPAKDRTNPKRKALSPVPQSDLRWQEKINFSFFLELPNADRSLLKTDEVKASQFLEPLFEFSGACAGCGETPYIKLVSQLFGDRALIANATGCSSIYGGNLPTTPYSTNAEGRGPAWANSLFEDNAEFGLGMRFALDRKEARIRSLIRPWRETLGKDLVDDLLTADQSTEKGIACQRERVEELLRRVGPLPSEVRTQIECFSDSLVKKSVWIIGGDGWAYDIGYGGLDHVMSLGLKVNILVLDTEVYSNTGGQASKSTPLGAVAKFAVNGKAKGKKDLGLIAMTYGDVYVARIAFGAKDSQTVKVLNEAEAYPGTSLIIAYSHCIAHGYGMQHGLEQQKLAVDSGYWPLYRFDPRRTEQGLSPLQLDSGEATVPLGRYTENEARFRILEQSDPERSGELQGLASSKIRSRQLLYQQLAGLQVQASGSSPKGGS